MSKARPNVIRLPIILRELEVVAVEQISPVMRRITLGGPQLAAFDKDGMSLPAFRSEGPDDHVKILLRDPRSGHLNLPKQADGVLDWSGSGRPIGRSYTPRSWTADSTALHLDFVLHGHGAAGRWAAEAKPGDTLHIAGPKSSLLVPRQADWYLLAGDETALPAIANWLEILPASAQVTAIIQVTSASTRMTLKAPDRAKIVWIEDPELRAETLLEAIAVLDWPVGEGFVWAAGERDAVRALRKHLIDERGHDRKAMDVVAYWNKGNSDEAEDAAHDRLHQLSDMLAPYALRVATTLRLFDHVAEGKTSTAALIGATGADPKGLALLVPVLLEYGLLEGSGDALHLGLMGQMLRTDQHDFDHFDLDGANARMDLAWAGLRAAVEGRGNGYVTVFGRPFYEDIHAQPELRGSFDEELQEAADYWSGPIARAIPAGPHVSDVGGGIGVLLAAILAHNPETRGTLVELPTTLEEARGFLAEKGLSERVHFSSQSFFEDLPAAPVQLLANVLHNWPDAEASRILRRCADAAGVAGKVFVIERLHDPETGHNNAQHSLHMFVLSGGHSRTAAEFAALGATAGLDLRSSRVAGPNLMIHEFSRR